MNSETRKKLGLEAQDAINCQLEDLLTIGSKIFYQTQLYPLIKMQRSAREIYLEFKGSDGHIPVLLNVEVKQTENQVEILCGGMEISNRNKYEKALIEAKKTAEEALNENAELIKIKNDLLQNQKILETQYREVKSLKEQQQEVFKLIAHDLQEPLRKSIFMSNYIVVKNSELSDDVVNRLGKIVSFNTDMSDKLLTLLRYKELDDKKLQYSSVDLNAIIFSAVTKLKMHSQGNIAINYPTKNQIFDADKRMLKRLFVELLRNSQKDQNHENQSLIIDISAVETVKNSYFETSDKYQYEKFIKITYSDNGHGFNRKLKKIIQKSELFNKVNIGLAYSKLIVEKHSGKMKAKSVKDKGVYYTILLPVNAAYNFQ